MIQRKKILVILLLLGMLLSLLPGSVAAQTAEATKPQTRAVSVPAISAPFTTHPAVFIVEDTYQIAFATNATGLAWVEIGGVKYTDSQNGLMNWKSKYHKITLPQEALDAAGSYTICFRSLSERPSYSPAPGSTASRTYPFDPIPRDRPPVFYCASDQHGDNSNALKISKYKSFDVYLFGGDYISTLMDDSGVKLLLDMTGSVTQGRKPIIYARGNHEIRGSNCEDLRRVSGYSETTGAYYTVKMPGIFGLVLDAGEDKVDSHAEYGGTVQFAAYRNAQTQWLREVLKSREWEKYPVRMAFCHVPFGFNAVDSFESVYKEWTELLDQMGVSLQISGHKHYYGLYNPNSTKYKSDPNYYTLLMGDRENGDYTYSASFVTVGKDKYQIENVIQNLTVRASKTVPVFTNAYVREDGASFEETKLAEMVENTEKTATKATVPAISSPYVLHPTVFAVEDGYQIIFPTESTGMAWVEVGGTKYYDALSGLMRYTSKYHSVRVPRVALDTARSYKVCYQSMTYREAYSPTHGSTVSRTYPFTPMADKKEPVLLCLSDFRGLAAEAKAVGSYKTFDGLYISGDYTYNGNSEANVKILLDTASSLTSGTKPVFFTRGNREVRGNYARLLDQIAPTSKTGKSYYTVEQSDFFAIVLDSGEDKADSHAEYGGTVDYQTFRKEQTQWLKEVLAEGKWKDYPTRVAFCHMPATRMNTAGLKEEFALWTELLDQMGISLMISGHNYNYGLYSPDHSSMVSDPSFATLISCDVDNTDYKYSGSFVTLGYTTIKVENVSAAKKLLKTDTTPNLTAPGSRQESDSYLMFDFNNDSVAMERYHSFVYGGINFDLKTSWDHETNTTASGISRGVLSFSPASETVTSVGVYSRPLNNSKGQWAYRPLHYFTKSTDYCQVRFKIDNAVATTTDGTAKFRLDVDCPNDLNDAPDVSKTYTRFEQSFSASEVVGKGYVTLTFPLNTTEYNKFSFMNLVHPQFVNLKSASGSTAVFSIDYIYIGPEESFPKQEDSLFFDFTDTAADGERYDSFTYNYLNFDDPSNWTVYNGSPMSTIADGALKIAVPIGNTDVSNSIRSRRENASTLHFVPGQKDILQVRIQIKNAVATTEDGIATFRMNLDRPNSIVDAAGTSRTWTNIPISFSLAEHVDKGWFILETPLTNAEYLASDWINLVHPQFLNMQSASGKTAEFLIDYIYIGPAHKNPTIGTVCFMAEDGSLLESCIVNRDTPASYRGAEPIKPWDEQNHYSFLGWAGEDGQLVDLSTLFTSASLSPSFCQEAHSFQYSCIDDESHSKSCPCGYTAEEAHSFEAGICPCGEEKIKEPVANDSLKLYHSLNLASDISVNYSVPVSVLEGYDLNTVYLECRYYEYSGNEQGEEQVLQRKPVLKGNYYYFTLEGLTAVHMSNEICAVLYGKKNGQEYYSPTDTYSIATYAYSQLGKENAADQLKTLCAELLRYGSAAQSFKGYRTDSLADAQMTQEQKALLTDLNAVSFSNHNVTGTELEAPTVIWRGKALDLNTKVSVLYVVDATNYEGDPAAMTLRVSYCNYAGETVAVTLCDPKPYGSGGVYYSFTMDQLLAAELRTVLTAQVYSGDTPISNTLTYSADTYGNGKTGALETLCKALFAYSDSAKAYFS